MGGQIFTSNGTFTWPDDTSMVRAFLWGGGGGGGNGSFGKGGGGGGACHVVDIYNDGGITTVSVVVGPGGAHGFNGTDSYIAVNGTVVGRAYGGKRGNSSSGGATSSRPASGTVYGTGYHYTVYANSTGGAGGDPYGGFGGGGGGAGGAFGDHSVGDGGDGHDAPNPGDPSAAVGGNGPGQAGEGGSGGELANGSDGEYPGGGGGGGAGGGKVSGSGGNGKVAFLWGMGRGTALTAVGCCCGDCDLLPTNFPDNITLTFHLSSYADTVDRFGPVSTVTIPEYIEYWGTCYGCTWSGCAPCCNCDGEGNVLLDEFGNPDCDFPVIVYDEMSYTTPVETLGPLEVFDGTSVQLEKVYFAAGSGDSSFYTFGPEGDRTYSPVHYCTQHYSNPLADPAIDDGVSFGAAGFLEASDRWSYLCPVPAPVDASDSDPSWIGFQTLCEGEGVGACSVSDYYWKRGWDIYNHSLVTVTIYHAYSLDRYYWAISTNTLVTDFGSPAVTEFYNWYKFASGYSPVDTSIWNLASDLSFGVKGQSPYTCYMYRDNFDTYGFENAVDALADANGALLALHGYVMGLTEPELLNEEPLEAYLYYDQATYGFTTGDFDWEIDDEEFPPGSGCYFCCISGRGDINHTVTNFGTLVGAANYMVDVTW